MVSNLDPKRTFTKLFDPKDLKPEFVKRAQNFKIRGSSGKLNIALDGLPEFPALGKDNPLRFGDMHFLDSLRGSSAPTTTGRTAPGRRSRTSTC